MNRGRLVKSSDDRFEGNHPNNIFEGYEKIGNYEYLPTIDELFYIGSLRTSLVTEILSDTDTEVKFRTENSTYLLTKHYNE